MWCISKLDFMIVSFRTMSKLNKTHSLKRVTCFIITVTFITILYVESYWLMKEWIVNCCLSNLDEKSTSLYRNPPSTISSTDLSSHDSSRSFWESRSSFVTRLFSSDQAVFELCCHFDLISSESHTHLRAHWSLDDFENQ